MKIITGASSHLAKSRQLMYGNLSKRLKNLINEHSVPLCKHIFSKVAQPSLKI